ncbi:hypothetical protein BY996DRAFT_1365360 [Phakopsora pachyrhizi]|nr:hypothetical protein BY996DRAFT_1365360 [Phakopsora pachyrhizi]
MTTHKACFLNRHRLSLVVELVFCLGAFEILVHWPVRLPDDPQLLWLSVLLLVEYLPSFYFLLFAEPLPSFCFPLPLSLFSFPPPLFLFSFLPDPGLYENHHPFAGYLFPGVVKFLS